MSESKPDISITTEVLSQRRRIDPLNDKDVKQNVENNEELTSFEKFVRRMVTQKQPIGKFFIGLGTFLGTAAMLFPEYRSLVATAVLSGVAGGLLQGGGSASIKSDQYDQVKNQLLKMKGLM